MPKDADAAASPLRVFGAMLRFYRTRAGMSQDQLGSRVYMSGDMIGKVETGQRTPSEQLVDALEALPELSAGGALTELREVLRDHLRQRPFPGWFASWLDREAQAVTLRSFEPLVVPGLLQTEDYARAILRTRVADTEAEVEAMVQARMDRQAILARDKPPMLWVLLDEGVLRRPVGGAKVMGAQLRHLAKAARQPSIVLEVIPARTGAHQGLNGGAATAGTAWRWPAPRVRSPSATARTPKARRWHSRPPAGRHSQTPSGTPLGADQTAAKGPLR